MRGSPSRSCERTLKLPRRIGADQPHAAPGLELVGDPRLVEPDRPDRAGVVGDRRLDDREPPARPALRDALDLDLDRDLLVVAEQARDLARADVPERGAVEQVADGLEAELAQLALERRPDAGQDVDGALEPLGARSEARPLPARGAVERGEGSQRPRRKGVCLCQRPFTSCMSQISFASQRIGSDPATLAAASALARVVVSVHDGAVGDDLVDGELAAVRLVLRESARRAPASARTNGSAGSGSR